MIIYNAIMILMIVANGVFYYVKDIWLEQLHMGLALTYSFTLYDTIMLVNTLILAWSVIAIRKMLKALKNAFTNDRLIGIHIVNLCIYLIIGFIQIIPLILIDKTDENNKEQEYKLLTFFFGGYLITVVF